MQITTSSILLGLLVGLTSAATPCTRAVANDYSLLMAGEKDLQAAYAEVDTLFDLGVWGVIDEIDGKKGGLREKPAALECIPNSNPFCFAKHRLTCQKRQRQRNLLLLVSGL